MNASGNKHDKKKKKRKVRRLRTIFGLCIVLVLSATLFYKKSFGFPNTVKGQTTQTTGRKADNNKQIITKQTHMDNDWRLILANKESPLPEGYSPTIKKLKNGQATDERIYNDLQAMMDAARQEGLNPLICSSYRSLEKQRSLFENRIKRFQNEGYDRATAAKKAAEWVAVPGTSEHQTGLAFDIVSTDYQMLDRAQEKTPEQQWLMQHCHEYGFILRYPEDKKDITGIEYEPWHYRYVGKEAAKEIMEQGICLEEYLER